MLAFNLKLSKSQRAKLENQLASAEAKGDLQEVKRILSLLSLAAGQFAEDVAEILKISLETIRQTINKFLSGGIQRLISKSRPGRPSKLTKTQRKKLYDYIVMGPEKLGFPGSCWRTPMIRVLLVPDVFHAAIGNPY